MSNGRQGAPEPHAGSSTQPTGEGEAPAAPEPPPEEPARKAARARFSLARWLWGGLLLAGCLTVVLLRFSELERLRDVLAGLRPGWVAVALVVQAATYVCPPLLWWLVIRRGGGSTRLRPLLPLSVVKLFVDNSLPTSGLSGSVAVVDGLARRGADKPLALTAVLADLISYFVAGAASVAITVLLLALRHRLEGFVLVLVALFSVLAVGVPLAILRLTAPGRSTPPAWARRIRPLGRLLALFEQTPPGLLRDPGLLARGALLRLAIFVLDAATLLVMLRALGLAAPASTAFAAFMVGSLAATVGPLPGGLGTFEAGAIATLTLLDVPPEEALAATLLLRGLTFWLPMLPGLALFRRELRATGASERRAV